MSGRPKKRSASAARRRSINRSGPRLRSVSGARESRAGPLSPGNIAGSPHFRHARARARWGGPIGRTRALTIERRRRMGAARDRPPPIDRLIYPRSMPPRTTAGRIQFRAAARLRTTAAQQVSAAGPTAGVGRRDYGLSISCWLV